MATLFTCLTLLIIKHCIFDFLYQPRRMWANKGTFGHIGGIEHSAWHVFGTLLILVFLLPNTADSAVMLFWVGVFEFTVHYCTDFIKMNVNRINNWTATSSEKFWWATGIDQMIHYLTYVVILVYVFG